MSEVPLRFPPLDGGARGPAAADPEEWWRRGESNPRP